MNLKKKKRKKKKILKNYEVSSLLYYFINRIAPYITRYSLHYRKISYKTTTKLLFVFITHKLVR